MRGRSGLAKDAIDELKWCDRYSFFSYILTDKTDYSLTWTKHVRSHFFIFLFDIFVIKILNDLEFD